MGYKKDKKIYCLSFHKNPPFFFDRRKTPLAGYWAIKWRRKTTANDGHNMKQKPNKLNKAICVPN
jgi:hypothetical protein